jgi:hypothetical protein
MVRRQLQVGRIVLRIVRRPENITADDYSRLVLDGVVTREGYMLRQPLRFPRLDYKKQIAQKFHPKVRAMLHIPHFRDEDRIRPNILAL